MKALLALAALATAAPVATGPGTQHFAGMPPVRFQGDGAAIVVFVSDVTPFCGTAPAGLVRIACTTSTTSGVPVIVLPNPAPYGEAGDPYAVIVAHELAHRNGWPGDHPL